MPSFFKKLFGKKSKKEKSPEKKEEAKPNEEKPKEEQKTEEPKKESEQSNVKQEEKTEQKKEEKSKEETTTNGHSETDHKEKETAKPQDKPSDAHEQHTEIKPTETQKEEPKKEEVHKEEKNHQPAQKTESGKFMKSVDVDPSLHKYIIGTKGATIQDIQSRTNSKITIPKDGGSTITVEAATESEVDSGVEEIKKVIDEQNAKKEQKELEYKQKKEREEQATAETDILYKKYQKEVDEHANNRSKYFEEAEKAYAEGNKDLARELREKAKEEGRLMEEAQKKASREIFNGKNKDNDKFTMDLHGLHTKDALEFVEERIKELKAEGHPKLCIIYGAGNHSDENGPKIKPAVVKLLNEQNIKFSEINNGSIDVEL